MQRFKLSHPSDSRLGGLLHLEYTPTDLARELKCSRQKILSAIKGGCPHRRTESGRLRIVGDEFRDWYKALCRRRKQPLGPNEAFCLACRRPVHLSPEDQLQTSSPRPGAVALQSPKPPHVITHKPNTIRRDIR